MALIVTGYYPVRPAQVAPSPAHGQDVYCPQWHPDRFQTVCHLSLIHIYVDPSLWENGINAAMLSYNLNGYHSETPGRRNDSIYAAFNGGMNLGAWRLRASGNYNWMTDSGSNYDFKNRYIQRDIASLRSQLILGESYTTGETFDSVSIRGIRLYSDSRMLPPTLSLIHIFQNCQAIAR